MTTTEIDILKIYVLLSPALVFLMALGMVWLTGWLDRRTADVCGYLGSLRE